MLILISYTHAEIKYIFLFKHKKSCAHFYCIIICTPLVSIRCSVNLSSKPSICICIWMSFEHIICSLRIVFLYLLTSILWCKIYSHNVSSWNKWFRRVTFFFFFFLAYVQNKSNCNDGCYLGNRLHHLNHLCHLCSCQLIS